MAGFLEEYGIGEARREKVVRWLVVSAIALTILAVVLYFTLRTWPARQRVRAFLEDLGKRDYQAAYALWGCAQPCRDYPFEKFMEDWGPKSEFANATAAGLKRSRYCDTGVIVTINSGRGNDLPLWYERSTGTLGFSPWPVCAPHIPAPSNVPPPAGLPTPQR